MAKKIITVLFILSNMMIMVSCEPEPLGHRHGEMAGEVTTDSVILQSRLTPRGVEGVAAFEIATNPDFQDATMTGWLTAGPENDSLIKTKVNSLLPGGTRYYYRLIYGADTSTTETGLTFTAQ